MHFDIRGAASLTFRPHVRPNPNAMKSTPQCYLWRTERPTPSIFRIYFPSRLQQSHSRFVRQLQRVPLGLVAVLALASIPFLVTHSYYFNLLLFPAVLGAAVIYIICKLVYIRLPAEVIFNRDKRLIEATWADGRLPESVCIAYDELETIEMVMGGKCKIDGQIHIIGKSATISLYAYSDDAHAHLLACMKEMTEERARHFTRLED